MFKVIFHLGLLCSFSAAQKTQREYCKNKNEDQKTPYEKCRKFNILSLSSAEYNGYMTASFVQYLERLAYFEAEEQYCIKRDNQRIAMPELFDVIAGTETGAIIGASLVIPGDENLVRNYANESMEFFKLHSSDLYVAQELNFWQDALVTLGFAAILACSVFACLRKKYYIDPLKIASLTEVEVIINTQLDLANKGELHSNDKEFVDQKIARLDQLAGEWKKRQNADPLMLEIFVKARAAVKKIATDSQVL